MRKNPASFRDPSGYVLEDADAVYRAILPPYAADWQALKQTRFLADTPGFLEFEELAMRPPDGINAIAVLKSQRLPFISWPYEWCFSQLRDAALLTLDIQLAAIARDFVLKDATAYNVQFLDGKPVFIDLLSLEKLREGRPWDAYGQFCSHFLAPLALMSLRDARLGLLSRLWIDGVPLELASQLLPMRSKLSPGLAMHLHMHASMRQKHADTKGADVGAKKASLGKQQLLDVADSLRRAVLALKPPAGNTEWGDYYTDTNYTAAARAEKEQIVARLAARAAGRLAVDLGANNGEFSRLMAPHFQLVLATDLDHEAVERHYIGARLPNVLPLVLDLANPSPALGWACAERASFSQRCQADFVSALALCHHLRITSGIPVAEIAAGLAALAAPKGMLMLEYVPKSDSQTRRLLARRDDVFSDYTEENFIDAFAARGMTLAEKIAMPDTERKILVFLRDSWQSQAETAAPF